MKVSHIRLWAAGLLTLFVAYYATITLYAHVHEVNGVLIVHSHPFTHHHSHTGEQALALHWLSTFTSLDAGFVESLWLDFPLFCSFTFCLDEACVLLFNGTGISLRAPPVFTCLS